MLCHPHTKAQLDAAIKKSQRKFKPGEAVPGLSRNKEAVLDAIVAKEERAVGKSPLLAAPYGDADKPAWPFSSPQVKGDPINDIYAEPKIIGHAKTGPVE
jgi:hypothetical protein